MLIPGIPDAHLEKIHTYLGPGKSGEYAYKHIPSGIMIRATPPPQMPLREFRHKLIDELAKKLKAAEIIASTRTKIE